MLQPNATTEDVPGFNHTRREDLIRKNFMGGVEHICIYSVYTALLTVLLVEQMFHTYYYELMIEATNK